MYGSPNNQINFYFPSLKLYYFAWYLYVIPYFDASKWNVMASYLFDIIWWTYVLE